MGMEIGNLPGFEVGDQRKAAVAEQPGPMVVRPHLHAAVVLPNNRRWRVMANFVLSWIIAVRFREIGLRKASPRAAQRFHPNHPLLCS